MPVEGNWERIQTPLRQGGRHERRTFALMLALVVGMSAGILFWALSSSSSNAPAPGCIEGSIASTLGGGQLHACGRDAKRLCHAQATRTGAFAREVQGQCRRLGYL